MPHLSKEQEADMVELIHNFPCLFGDVPTCTTVLQHDIDVGDAKPIKQHPYRVNTMKRSVMKQEVAYLLEHHLAHQSSSPWSSPCLLVPKPDTTSRFCTDYRKANAVTIPDSFPMPRIDDHCRPYRYHWVRLLCYQTGSFERLLAGATFT